MLRALQTKVLSEKIAGLFDNLTPATLTTPKAYTAGVERNTAQQDMMRISSYSTVRRRRHRRKRMLKSQVAVRTSWF